MPDTNWDRYVIKPPKPTFSEKIKEIGKNVNEWKRHKHYRRHGLKLKDVAAELGTNSAYLSFYIRKAEDTTFVPWLNNLRIEEAKRLMLSHPEMSIYDIGYKVGQPHPASFKQAFVKITGQTPDEWKIENVEINKIMIKKVLTYCADQLNAYLSRYHHRPEGLAEVGHIGSWHFVQQNLPFDLGARNSFPQ